MTTIFERIETALNTLSPVTNAMGRMLTASGDLPAQFLVYNVIDTSPALHLDDEEVAREYLVQVSIFSRAGLAVIPDVDTAMLAAGFTRGSWRQLPQDAQSGHYHLSKDFHYYEEGVAP